MLKKDQQVK